MLSVDTMVKQEIRKKIEILSGLRDAQAQAIGLVVAKSVIGNPGTLAHDVGYITQLLETALVHSSRPYEMRQNEEFVDPVASSSTSPQEIADRLISLSKTFNHRRASFVGQISRNARPSKLSRYWPLVVGFYLGGSQALSYLNNREDQIKLWLYDLQRTISSFWTNWIIQPTTKILATIRHDEGSEVALLSSRSLSADLESLERMVVEFAQDNPQYSMAESLEALKESARNGDLTPVLVAYESNIKSPLRSALTGSLVRALLIQIQKTKVDVEVAINGIDKLLKSQQLVFGFVGSLEEKDVKVPLS
ncbi:Putative uncharacterized protein [Taphrina deformans PYCC 5710]|uniref:Uncharacterized protein n=1 Tax=Taphrina deformans (strain PYCC 5710 / ATCC 11124 / CBS 356.35 / IMI 108563 / JCM 9778 / NBRC 8474) TaxID=1097556 RepID=R4XAW2_TAPDE|nr:Putative uncharacterized protein [Taphrina deformans PYCC 5710]|eukprot:CCG83004.1 Putative uncharacterized protein [Taphrina deformans PYCC 5710]